MKVLSALHDSIPVRFGHLQEKIMRVGRTIYVADLRSFSSTVDNVATQFPSIRDIVNES
jgi:hypothetical protein